MNVLLVSCHPLEESFTAYVASRALETLEAAHHVTHVDLYGDDASHEPAVDLERSDALVLVYPTWWSSQPAPLVEWIDRCLSARDRFPELQRIVVVTSHGSPRYVNLIEGEVGRRVLLRGLRRRAHPRCRASWIALYNLDRSTFEDRTRFVHRMERKLSRLRQRQG